MELLKKLNHKQQNEIIILNAPKSFKNELDEIRKNITVIEDEDIYGEIDFALIFIKNNEDIEKYAEFVLTRVSKNALIWFAFQKKISTEYNWEIINDYQFEPIRQIAINSELSALRFRPYKNYARCDDDNVYQEEKIKTKKKIEFY